jgi:hypothetical protein
VSCQLADESEARSYFYPDMPWIIIQRLVWHCNISESINLLIDRQLLERFLMILGFYFNQEV